MSGETWVLLHGFTGAPSSFDALLSELPAGVSVLRPSLMGHAGAPDADVAVWDDEIERLARLVAAEAGAGVHLLGYSLGARVALGLLAAAPGLAKRATLIGGRLPPVSRRERLERAERDAALAARLETEPLERFVRDWEALPLFESQRALDEAIRSRRRAERLSHDPRGLASSLRTLGLAAMPDLRGALSSVTVPVTLAVGGEDGAFLAHARELSAYLPFARLVVFEGAGHDLTLERPAELAALLKEKR